MRYSVLIIGIFVFSLFIIPVVLVVLLLLDSPMMDADGRWAFVVMTIVCLVFFHFSRPLLKHEMMSREILRDMISADIYSDEAEAEELVERCLSDEDIEFTRQTDIGPLLDHSMPEDEKFISEIFNVTEPPFSVIVGLNRGTPEKPILSVYLGPVNEVSRDWVMKMAHRIRPVIVD